MKERTHYRYRIQVGDEYTYRESSFTLDQLVFELLEGERASIDVLVADPDTARQPVAPEAIQITVERTAKPEKEKWYKVEPNDN